MIANDVCNDNFARQAMLPYFANDPATIPLQRPDLGTLAAQREQLPRFVQHSAVASRYLDLLGPLDWVNFPNRDPSRPWPGQKPHPRSAYTAAFIVKLNQGLNYMSDLREYLCDNPALVWALGFRLTPDPTAPWGFDVDASLPTARHFGRVLRELPAAAGDFLLSATVRLLQLELPDEFHFGDTVSLDTKAILAWVRENNPKAYVKERDRLDKTRQPKGDPDCKLGCKKKANRSPASANDTTTAAHTPTKNPVIPTNFSPNDTFYWGYASGVVATKIPDWGEFVLAEYTQTFDRNDATYFFPLMTATEARLGFRPRYGALDSAYDAHYVYDYFAKGGGFAAVPFANRGRYHFEFNEAGLPLCQAGLAMPLKATYICHTSEVEHQKGRYACPLLFPDRTETPCPVNHKNHRNGGCLTTMATAKGARTRYQLDRENEAYKQVYNQRTATERINALAKELGIEQPRLRNGRAIARQNTLIYVLLNLRALQRVKAKKRAGLP